MSWEAIRGLSKYNKLELWDSERTVKPILLNNITYAAEEARELLPKFDRAVGLLHEIMGALDCQDGVNVYLNDDNSEIEERVLAFLRELEGGDG